jgi:transcriptional/translational regulatory protein YebC/TACO1
MFKKKGLILVEEKNADEEKLMSIVLDAGAEDMNPNEGIYEIITPIEGFESVKKAIEENKIEISVSEITMLAQNTIKLEGKQAEQMLKLIEILEDHDDVQKTYSNFDIPAEMIKV